jgi:glycosyltransferase involved in cell wall biosynthesis
VRVCFYAAVRDRAQLDLVEFYRQDLEALRELGHRTRVATSPRELRGPDELYWVWWPTSGAPAVMWAWLRRRPSVLVTALSTFDTTRSGYAAKPPWTRGAARVAMRLADLTLAVSHATARGCEPLRPRALDVAWLAVDVERYVPGRRDEHQPYALTVSQLTADNVERKRLLDVVAAAEVAADRGSNLRFVIAGARGAGAGRVEAEIRARRLSDRVRLVGAVSMEEKLRLMQGASVYLQPTRYESFGLAIAEAMACGLPVVSHAVGAVPEVVGDAGRLLRPEAGPAEIAEAAEELSGSAGRALGERARARALAQFPPAAHRARVAHAIRAVTSRPDETRNGL